MLAGPQGPHDEQEEEHLLLQHGLEGFPRRGRGAVQEAQGHGVRPQEARQHQVQESQSEL